jgi:hypothetical protein
MLTLDATALALEKARLDGSRWVFTYPALKVTYPTTCTPSTASAT